MPWLTILVTMIVGVLMMLGLGALLNVSVMWILGASFVGVMATASTVET